MSSYYDDEDFAEEYRRRDEEALDSYITERERDRAPCERAGVHLSGTGHSQVDCPTSGGPG